MDKSDYAIKVDDVRQKWKYRQMLEDSITIIEN